jgi:hypothetical protein
MYTCDMSATVPLFVRTFAVLNVALMQRGRGSTTRRPTSFMQDANIRAHPKIGTAKIWHFLPFLFFFACHATHKEARGSWGTWNKTFTRQNEIKKFEHQWRHHLRCNHGLNVTKHHVWRSFAVWSTLPPPGELHL